MPEPSQAGSSRLIVLVVQLHSLFKRIRMLLRRDNVGRVCSLLLSSVSGVVSRPDGNSLLSQAEVRLVLRSSGFLAGMFAHHTAQDVWWDDVKDNSSAVALGE